MLRFLAGLVVGAALAFVALPYLQERMFTLPELASATTAPAARPATLPLGVQGQVTAAERALADAKQSGRTVPVTLTFTEPDLTASAAAYFPQSFAGATLSDPVVRLHPGQLVLTAKATALFVRTNAVVVVTPIVVDGRPAARVESATIGGAPLPEQFRASIAAQLGQAIAAGLPPRLVVTAITVVEGTLTVTGTANP